VNIKLQIEKDFGAPVSPSAVDICDYQCNAAFAIAKTEKRAPMDVAREIADKFKSRIATAEAVAPGFVNFKVNEAALETAAQEVLKTGKLPLAKLPAQTVFFDYGGPNIAKELHVGHLRPHIIGEALKRVFQSLGARTIADSFLGDWGLQIGLVIAELEASSGKPETTLEMLNEVYPRASARSKTDLAFKARAEEITLRLQQQQQPYYDLWKKIREVSVAKIRENAAALSCTHDTMRGESYAQQYIPEVLEILKQNGAYTSDNCLVMDVKEDTDTGPMPPILLQKSNGGELYSTSDVATIYYRFRDYRPDEFIYVNDARQELHMRQVFRCAKRGNLVAPGTRLTHVSFGTMNGKDGKPFKTRAGGTIRFEDIINLVTEAAQKRLAENGKAENPGLAQKIGIAALKFADLSNHVRKDYIFDLEKFTSFEGKTGPYILYTIARIKSLLAKSKDEKQSGTVVSGITRNLVMKVIKLADCYPAAAANYTLNGIADSAFALAAEFNLFYACTKILAEPDTRKRQGYLALCKIIKNALEFSMDTLAIDVVEEM